MATETKKTSTEVVKASKKQSEITNIVLKRVEAFQRSGELRLPKNYSPENALKAAQLLLAEQKDRNGKSVLEACTRTSIASALLKTVVWGLAPHKGQVYYIPYGPKLECSISYTGNIAIAKRYGNLKSIKANCIMEGDDFEFEIDSKTGLRKIIKHSQTLESVGSGSIKGAYAIIELNDGTFDVEIMSFSQIEKSWQQGATKGDSPAHRKFPDQMSIKTVLNRACKLLIRTSDDQVLYEDDDNKDLDRTKEDVNQEINDNANQNIIDVDFEEEEEIESTPDPTQTKTPPKTFKKPEPKEEPQPKESPKAGTQEKAF